LIFLQLALPGMLRGQVGFGARIGTLGLGPEISYAAGQHIVLRGGIGFIPLEPERTFSDIDYTLHPPSSVWNIGVDVYPSAGGLRFGGGIVRWQQYELLATQTGSTTVGGTTYTGTIDLDAVVTNANQTAPYLLAGYGRTTKPGIGFFVDVGVAFIGEADIELSGTCTLSNGSACPGNFESDLEAEEADAEDDIGKYLELLPILQVGIRIGVGRR
jgi:hypothetical protein